MRWNDLSMSERAAIIQLGVKNGVTSLSNIKDAYNSYADGGQLHTKTYYYDKDIKGWRDKDNNIIGGGIYVTLPDGKKVHLNTDGTVSKINKYGYIGEEATNDPSNIEGRNSLKRHIRKEIVNQDLPYAKRNYKKKDLDVRDNLFSELLRVGFNRDQANALLMNSSDESEFIIDREQVGGGAKGLFQFDKDERKAYERRYRDENGKVNWSISNQAEFLHNIMKEQSGKNTEVLHNYPNRLKPSERIIDGYYINDSNNKKWKKVPTDESYMSGFSLKDTIPYEDYIHRHKYAVKVNEGYKRLGKDKKGRDTGEGKVGGNTSRYTGLPLNHYIDIFMNSNEGDYTPEELSFMFMVGHEKAGRPHSPRFDTSILK